MAKGKVGGGWFRPVTLPVPTLKTWALLFALLFGLAWTVGKRLHDYLAVEAPDPGAKTLVIETGASPGLVAYVKKLSQSKRYTRYIPVGMPLDPLSPLAHFGTMADVWQEHLIRIGIPSEQIELVRLPGLPRHRTAHKALAVARHLADHPAAAIDLMSTSTHARRSQLLYAEALAPVSVGVRAAPQPYDMKHWWRSSAGVRAVINELVALGYVWVKGDEVEQAQAEWDGLSSEQRQASGRRDTPHPVTPSPSEAPAPAH